MCLSLKLDLAVVGVMCRIYAMFCSYNLCRFNCKLGPTENESYTKICRRNFADPYIILIIILKGVLHSEMKLYKIISKVKVFSFVFFSITIFRTHFSFLGCVYNSFKNILS